MKKTSAYKLLAIYSTVLSFFIFSCRSTENSIPTGQAIVKINIKGNEFETKNLKLIPNHSINEKTFEIPINNKYSYIAKIATEPFSDLRTKSLAVAPKGIKYRVVVFTNDIFVTQKVYTTGQSKPDDGQDLLLDAGKQYLFVFYSYNSATITPPAVDPQNPFTLEGISASSNLMYYSVEKTLSGNSPNYLDVVLKPKFSKLNITMTAPNERKITSAIAKFGPSIDNNRINLKYGTIKYGNIFTSGEDAIFSGYNTSKINGYAIVAYPEINTAHITFSTVGLDNEIQDNKTIENLKITPGFQYTIDLTIIDEGITIETALATNKFSYAITSTGEAYVTGSTDPTSSSSFSKIQGISSIKKIAAGLSHILVLTSSGDIYVKGSNNIGQIGLGDQTYTNSFVRLTNIPKVQDIAAGDNHSLLLTTSGDVYGTGGNDYGQLGFMDLLNRTTFTKPSNSSNIKKIAAGSEHSILLTTSGEIKVAGLNTFGQLGIGNTKPSIIFQVINGINNVKDIDSSYGSTMLLTTSGEIYVAGYNALGQLGLGDKTNRTSFTKVKGITNANKISIGKYNAFILSNSGEVYSTGWNPYGQLGFGDEKDRASFTKIPGISKIKNIAVGEGHSLLINSKGKVYGAGLTVNGQMGSGISAPKVKSFTRLSIRK